MATSIFNYNGSLLTVVQDGTISINAASIAFPGRAYPIYGEAINQDLLWIMQNFANPSPPQNPVVGQLWYDTANQIVKFYSGTNWVAAGGVLLSSTPPVGTFQLGNFWYDTVNKQLRIWNGTSWDLVGPLGSAVNADPENTDPPTFSLFDAIRLSDTATAVHQVWRFTVGGTVVAMLSKDPTFTPVPAIIGFTTINPGFNLSSAISDSGYYGDTALFRGTQTNLPSLDNTWDLGSPTLRFANIYAVNVDGVPTLAMFNSLASNVSALTSNVSTLTGNVNVISNNLTVLTSNVEVIETNIRSRLTANTIFYIGYPGFNDNNNGLSTLTSFQTILGAWNAVARRWDCQGFNVTFQLNNGTYPSTVLIGGLLNAGTITILGNVSTTSLVTITGVNSVGLQFSQCGKVFIGGMTFSATGSTGQYNFIGEALVADTGSRIELFSPIAFNLSTSAHIGVYNGGVFATNGVAYAINGGAIVHINMIGGRGATVNSTITLVGTPNFSTAFASVVGSGSELDTYSVTFLGAATGPRYFVSLNGVISTLGAGASYLPGNSSGTATTGGQYA